MEIAKAERRPGDSSSTRRTRNAGTSGAAPTIAAPSAIVAAPVRGARERQRRGGHSFRILKRARRGQRRPEHAVGLVQPPQIDPGFAAENREIGEGARGVGTTRVVAPFRNDGLGVARPPAPQQRPRQRQRAARGIAPRTAPRQAADRLAQLADAGRLTPASQILPCPLHLPSATRRARPAQAMRMVWAPRRGGRRGLRHDRRRRPPVRRPAAADGPSAIVETRHRRTTRATTTARIVRAARANARRPAGPTFQPARQRRRPDRGHQCVHRQTRHRDAADRSALVLADQQQHVRRPDPRAPSAAAAATPRRRPSRAITKRLRPRQSAD